MAPARRPALIYAVVFAGGAAALAVEVVWARMLQRAVGSTSLGVALAAGSILAGLGLGAYAGERLRARIRRPLAALGGAEIAGAGAALAFTLLLARGPGFLLEVPGGEAAIGALAALAAAPWGAAFPLAVAALPAGGPLRRRVRALYGWNAVGAAGGAAAAGLAGVPAIGEWGTVAWAAALEASAGAAAVLLARRAADPGARAEPQLPDPETARGESAAWAAFLFLSGLVVLYWEVLWTRILVLTVGGTAHAFSLVLASVLLGIGAGSIILPGRSLGRALWALPALAAAALAAAYTAVPFLPDAYLAAVRRLDVSPLAVGAAGAAAVAFVPNFLLGSLFPRAAGARVARAGTAFAVNAAGSIAGALLGGPIAARLWSLESAYRAGVGAAAALAVAGACLARSPRGLLGALAAVLALLAISIGPLSAPWDPRRLLSGVYQWSVEDLESLPLEESFRAREIIAIVPGREVIVTVELHRAANTVHVRGNGKVEGSVPADPARPGLLADMPTQVLLGALPAALHARTAGAEALLIGLGSGVTLGALADPEAGFAPGAIDAIEVEEAYLAAIRSDAARAYFDPYVPESLPDPAARGPARDGVRLHFGDARRLLAAGLRGRLWDAIVSQPSEPWIPAAAPLFTIEFLEAAAERLKPAGAFFQWLQLYKLDLESARLFARTFRRVFPRVFLVHPPGTGEVILIGSRAEVPIERLLDAPAGRWAAARLVEPADRLAIFLAGPDGIDRWVGLAPGLPVNTDSRSEVQYRATRSLYSGGSLAFENLQALRRIGAEDPISRYLPRALRADPSFLRHLADRNIRVAGDLGEALAILEGDESEEAERLRAQIDKLSAAAAGGSR